MSLFVRIVVLFGVLATGVSANENAIDAKQMLESMKKAMDELNYHGTVALYKNGKLDTMRLVHAVKGGREQERLVSLNSPMREIVMDQDQIRCEFQDSNEAVVMLWPSRQSFFPDLPSDLKLLDAYYQFKQNGTATIANQHTYVIDIEPKDEYRYGRKIWLSQENFLPLKFVLLDQAGMALEQVMFSDLKLAESLPLVNVKGLNPRDKETKQVHRFKALPYDEAGFVLTRIPDGFKKIFLTRRTMRAQDKLIDHLLLSDGFASVSVYFEEIEEDLFAEQHVVGAVNSYSRPLGRYLLTVMGEVPKKTVQLIAEGAELRSSE